MTQKKDTRPVIEAVWMNERLPSHARGRIVPAINKLGVRVASAAAAIPRGYDTEKIGVVLEFGDGWGHTEVSEVVAEVRSAINDILEVVAKFSD